VGRLLPPVFFSARFQHAFVTSGVRHFRKLSYTDEGPMRAGPNLKCLDLAFRRALEPDGVLTPPGWSSIETYPRAT